MRKSIYRRYRLIGICLLLPAIAVYLLFMAYPLLDTFRLSFTSWSGFGARKGIGFINYLKVFKDDIFYRSLGNTLYFAFFSSIISVSMGIFLSWLIMFQRRMEGQVMRTILFAPNMISPTITGLLFIFIFTEDIGLINNILQLLGLNSLKTAWLVNMNTVKPAIVLVTVWRQFGLPMVLCYAGLQNIPMSMIESARLDGASDRQVLFRILIPLIKPMIQLSTMFTMVGGLRIYDSIVSLTGGGPARLTIVMPMWIVNNAFTYTNYGYASTLCVIFIFIVFTLMLILKAVFKGETYEY